MAAIIVGSGLGILLGSRLPDRTRELTTQALGLVVLVVAALNVAALLDADWIGDVGSTAPILICLAAIVIGGVIGSLLRIEARLEGMGGWLQRRFSHKEGSEERRRFIEGFVDASLLFCIGPLAILGALSDGLGQGIEQLALKATLDGVASVAFAATLGWGVALSVIPVGILQGVITLLGIGVGSVVAASVVASITATGGILIIGIGLRLLRVSTIAVGDLLPALVVAPLLTLLVTQFY